MSISNRRTKSHTVYANPLGSSALAASVSQSIFINGIFKRVSRQLPSLDPSAVISAGAANLQQLASNAETLRTLREIYASSLREVFVYALVAASIAFTFTFGMEWLNLKTKSDSNATDGASLSDIA